jgi:hypothetical protein
MECSNLTSVTIPKSVTSIDYGVFSYCNSLTDITVETGNTFYSSEGGVLFNKDKTVLVAYPSGKMGAYIIPNSVTGIENYAFYGNNGLMSATISNSVISIGNYAFSNSSNLKTAIISNSVTSIGNDAFRDCHNLTNVTCLASAPPSLGTYTFFGIATSSLTVPDASVSAYSSSAWSSYFSSITGLQTWNCGPGGSPSVIATLSGSTLTISGTGAMEQYLHSAIPWESSKSSITAAVIENGVTSIGNQTFGDCQNLVSATIPNGVTSIGDSAFGGCNSLTGITIPASVTGIGRGNFWQCGNLAGITVTAGNTAYSSENGVLFNADKTALVVYPAGKTGTEYSIPGSVTSIRYDAFGGCGLTSVTIPESVTGIGEYAFSSCTGLTSVTCLASTPPSLGINAFNSTPISACTLYVPEGTVALYEATPVWKDFDWIREVAPAPSLSVSPSSLDFTAAGGSRQISITSNTNWTVASSASWATVSAASGSGNGTITVTAALNSGNVSLTATITVSGSGISRTVTVTQGIPALSVSPQSLDFSVAGGSKTFDISSNVAWTVTSKDPWATVSAASGSGNGTVTVTVAPNSSTGSRMATIEVSASANGVGQAVGILQEGRPTLTVSPSSLHYATAGGSQDVNVASNRDWTASSHAPWLTATWESGSVLRIAAAANTGYARADSVTVTADGLTETVYVTQDAAQQIIAEPTPPVDNQGTIEIALEIPVNEQFSITFTVTLPVGFILDQQATSLVSDLLGSYQLSITPNGQGGWLFGITPALSVRSGEETAYREVINIVYTVPEAAPDGDYEVKIQDVDLTTDSGEVIHQDEITVPVRITSSVGNASIDAGNVRYANGVLTVNTPAAERITVYSLSGAVMYQARKAAGEASFDLNGLPKGVFIAKGSSGWTRKAVISD